MPINANISGQIRHTSSQAYIKKVERGTIINIDTIKQEMDQDSNRLDDTSGDINPYHEIIVNNTEQHDIILLQMEQWSILSNMVKYIQYDRHPMNFYNLDIKAVNQKSQKKIIMKKKKDRS